MQPFVELLKQFLRPSSITFMLALIAGGIGLSFLRRTQRFARWYFLAVFAMFWMLSAPACSERLLLWQGGGYLPIERAADARGARLVVVLGAGNATIQARGYTLNQVAWVAALRILEAARLYRLLDQPTIIVSGGTTGRDEGSRPEAEGMRTAILELGVPADHVIVETESKTTREEAIIIARMLADRPAQPVVIVTSPTHMRRSLAVFRSAGLDPIPSVAPFKSDHSLERLRWLPSEGGLQLSDIVIYDALATLYYRLSGWTTPN
jgi:uncharacterized SAM-binding protein YcdF (DUF218 family)